MKKPHKQTTPLKNDVEDDAVSQFDEITEVDVPELTEEILLPQDGFTELPEPVEEVADIPPIIVEAPEKTDVIETVSTEPLPSTPVDEPVIRPQHVALTMFAMHYLGTASLEGMLGRGGVRRAASYPVIVYSAENNVVGVVVVGDPGDMSATLATSLEDAGHAGAPFRLVAAISQSKEIKLAAARAIAAQTDASLDRVGALMALGFTPEAMA